MTEFTSKQKSDLNNSMEAARLFGEGLGTEVSDITGSLTALPAVASGSFSASSINQIASGLTTVSSVVVTMSGSPTLEHAWFSASAVGATIWVEAWKPTSDSDTTPVIADNNYVDGYWIAVGT